MSKETTNNLIDSIRASWNDVFGTTFKNERKNIVAKTLRDIRKLRSDKGLDNDVLNDQKKSDSRTHKFGKPKIQTLTL